MRLLLLSATLTSAYATAPARTASACDPACNDVNAGFLATGYECQVIDSMCAKDETPSTMMDKATTRCDQNNTGGDCACGWSVKAAREENYIPGIVSYEQAEAFAVISCAAVSAEAIKHYNDKICQTNKTVGFTGTWEEFCAQTGKVCYNNNGYGSCKCQDGFESKVDNNGMTCVNIDDCAGVQCTANSKCVDGIKDYECKCDNGYEKNGNQCVSIDECKTQPCHLNATCVDGHLSRTCFCNAGFTGDGDNCDAIDECQTQPCHANATCVDGHLSRTCTCDAGFTGSGDSCAPIDECLTADCDANADCQDLHNDYKCTCKAGYTGSGKVCISIDDCQLNPCHDNATCVDGHLSRTCACKAGFTGNGEDCTAIDECQTQPCHANATCVDGHNSRTCTCIAGFSGNGDNCEAIDECQTQPCHANATCVDGHASRTCTCIAGFSGNGDNCEAIDECQTQPCHANATCVDGHNSRTCTCIAGFSGNGDNCEAIDECQTQPCHANATCFDGHNSRTCTCNAGFTGNGDSCAPIDDCKTASCPNNSTCVDGHLSHTCNCDDGFVKNVNVCDSIDDCASHKCGANSRCVDGHKDYTCVCDDHWENTNKTHCVDVDDCSGQCTGSQQTCNNNIGAAFTCSCNTGYEMNTTTNACVDVDECAKSPCHAQADCTNTAGSHSCKCKDGYIGDGVNKCDIDGGFNMKCNKDNTVTVTIPYTRKADVTYLEYGSCNKSSDGVTVEAQTNDFTYVIQLDVAKCNSAGAVSGLNYDQDAVIRLGRGNLMFSEFIVDSQCEYNGEYTIKFDYGTLETVDTSYNAAAGLVNLTFEMSVYDFNWTTVVSKGPNQAGEKIYLGLKVKDMHKLSSSKQFAPTTCGVVEDGQTAVSYTLFDTSTSCKNDDIDLLVKYDGAAKEWKITHTLFLLGNKSNSKYSMQCEVLVCDQNQKNEDNKCKPILDRCTA